MSHQDFDIRAILKPHTLDEANGDGPLQRHEVVMDTGRLIFITLCVILICGIFFTVGFIIGKNQPADVTGKTPAAEAPLDGLVAAVPGDDAAAEGAPAEADPGAAEAPPADDSGRDPVGIYESQSTSGDLSAESLIGRTETGELKSLDEVIGEMARRGEVLPPPAEKQTP